MAARPVIRGIVTSRNRQIDVRFESSLYGLRAVPDLVDNLEVRLAVEHHPQAATHKGVIIREQDPDL